MSINEYDEYAYTQDYEDQEFYDEDERVEDERYAEQCDEPDINNVKTGIKKCKVCEAEGEHETWECPLVENVNRSEVLQRRIQQARVMYKTKIRAEYL
jgi:ribosomal protein L37AE/L43A